MTMRAVRVRPAAAPIGPGRLVLVVGPSGAGKDTLIGGAQAACAADSGVLFPQRIVTRPSSSSENNATLSDAAFDEAAAEGAFALSWGAHGHKYGVPAAVDDDIRAGRTLICNVSRTVIAHARRRYAHVVVVLVTAPREVLAARLVGRRRPSDGDILGRLQRATEIECECEADIVIENVGNPAAGIRQLLDVIHAPAGCTQPAEPGGEGPAI